ncbi:MAG: LD-carboxypeptidase [Paludibacter sp.]|nr:LD-carboxypeptidase [Paludibacter sp.]
MMPPFLNHGDEIRIVSPSGTIDPKYIDGATQQLVAYGFKVTEGKFTRNAYGRFGGTTDQRTEDFQNALNDPEVKAILCSRGGYGVAQIIDKIDFTTLKKQLKWLIGFSDITIFHNAITNLDIASIHAIMAKHITELPQNSEQIKTLIDLLLGKLPEYHIPAHGQNRRGEATGKLIGGNLSVLYGMRATPYDLPFDGNILFIEEIAEKPYHIDRMMQNLRLSGALAKLSGLVVGQFSDCEEDPLMKQTIHQIIKSAVEPYDYPVCFDFPAGHVNYNLPLILGQKVHLQISGSEVGLNY